MPNRRRLNKRIMAHFVMLEAWLLNSAAYRSLSCPARAEEYQPLFALPVLISSSAGKLEALPNQLRSNRSFDAAPTVQPYLDGTKSNARGCICIRPFPFI